MQIGGAAGSADPIVFRLCLRAQARFPQPHENRGGLCARGKSAWVEVTPLITGDDPGRAHELHTVARPVGDRVHIPQRDRVGDRGKCFSGALHIARDDGRHLFARDRRVRFKAPAVHTVDDVLLRGPFDIRRVPAPGRDIGEGNARVVRFVDLHKPAQHRHEHGARERVIRRETSAADAAHETVGSNVFHGISIPCTGGHIHEARDGSAR